MPDDQIAPVTLTPPAPPVTQSWDVITSDPPAAPAVEEVVAPAETPALETTPPLPAESPLPRESESQIEPETPKETKPEPKDEDVQDGDTPEILALPSKSASRRWAREQFKAAKPINTFLDLDQPIASFGDDLYTRSESRYFEHVDDIAKHHADYLTEKLFGVKSYDEVKAKLTPNGQPTPTTTSPQPSTALLTATELDSLTNEQITQKFEEARQTAAQQAKTEMEAAMTAKVAELQKQLDAVTQKTTTHEQQAREAQVTQIGNDLKQSVVKVVDEVIHDSGLEVKTDDPPKIANLKRAASRMIKTEYESTFDADEDNLKVVERVQEFARRLERHNAFREEDNLKVRLRAACEKIKQSDEFKAIFDEIESSQSKATTRTGGPVVPAPGAPAGITPKSPMNWDEAIQQAAASS